MCCRAAARCNKGIEVLLAVALEHFVLVVVRVLRGPTQADESAKKLRKLVHCQWCEERVFLKLGNMVDGKRKSGEESGNVVKKLKPDVSLEHPPFYYSIHRHSIRGMNMPKVSRTHFDPTGVRTNATLQQFKSVLTKYSVPTCTNAGASAQMSVSADKPV
ncbi:hypothetical protein GOODEAATRI_007588 [Goodea atripinnis]|uniref:Uncharacterized protein n=1 Tax=Goodea atripinnis TaxID=208336 RepID=A0ABV0NJB5_9TELE